MSNLSKKEILIRIQVNRAKIRQFGVKKLGLFGSVAQNTHTPESDVDLLVEFEPGHKTFDNFMALSFLLEDLLGRPVELVTPESLSPYIGPHIRRGVENVPLAG